MIEKRKKEYDAPMVELIEARVEKGFQTSGVAGGSKTGSTTEGLTDSDHNYGNGLFQFT